MLIRRFWLILLLLSVAACTQGPSPRPTLPPDLDAPTATPSPAPPTPSADSATATAVVPTATLDAYPPAATALPGYPLPLPEAAGATPPATETAEEGENVQFFPIVIPPADGAGAALQISVFEVVSTTLTPEGGRRVSLRWETVGASGVTLTAGTQLRFPPGFDGPPNGTQTIGLVETYYPNPLLTLMARDAAGATVNATLALDWSCSHSYYFGGAPPVVCPAGPVQTTAAAEQTFENGIMIWLGDLDTIYAILWDGRFWRVTDTWDETQPEFDPAISAPPDRQQPLRGFGKVWRENDELREAIGWPPGVELGYTAQYQRPHSEAPPETFYVSGFDGRVYKLIGSDVGQWEPIE